MTCFSTLNKRIDILSPQRLPDGVGGSSISWALLATVWARVASHQAGEKPHQQTLTSRTSHIFTMRYRDDVTADMKIQLAQKDFEILSIINIDEQNTWLKISCVQERL